MKKLSNVALLDIGLHVVVVVWFIILLRKAASLGIHLTSMEFAIPLLGAVMLVCLVKLINDD